MLLLPHGTSLWKDTGFLRCFVITRVVRSGFHFQVMRVFPLDIFLYRSVLLLGEEFVQIWIFQYCFIFLFGIIVIFPGSNTAVTSQRMMCVRCTCMSSCTSLLNSISDSVWSTNKARRSFSFLLSFLLVSTMLHPSWHASSDLCECSCTVYL